MSPRPPNPPNPVPEEDLSRHDNFQPIIAENGLIRNPRRGEPEVSFDDIPLQDLVQLRHAQEEQAQSPVQEEQPAVQEPAQAEVQPSVSQPNEPPVFAPEPLVPAQPVPGPQPAVQPEEFDTTFAISRQDRPTVDLGPAPASAAPEEPASAVQEEVEERVPLARAAQPPKMSKQPPQQARQPRKHRRWPWVVLILAFLFLGTITGVMPVERIPLLRSLAYQMGFSKADTSRMSFLRALLTWTDKTIGLPGQWGSERAGGFGSLAAEGEGFSPFGTQADNPGRTALMDMNALRSLQQRRGQIVDGVRGAVQITPGNEQSAVGPAALPDGAALSAQTEANQAGGEVFFGSDNSALNRDFLDGYDSVNTLKRRANPQIVNGHQISWLNMTAQRLLGANTGLNGINRELLSNKMGWDTLFEDIGDSKPHRDLYHAWITSRMSKYTSNLMLKKSLADSSFLGAEIKDTAANVLEFGGVHIDSDSFNQDQKAWQEYLEFEKRCKEEIRDGGGKQVQDAIDTFNELFSETNPHAPGNVYFPSNCQDALTTSYSQSAFYRRGIRAIRAACYQMQAGYASLKEKCLMQVEEKENRCDDNEKVGNLETRYEGTYVAFQADCRHRYCTEKHADQDISECLSQAEQTKSAEWGALWPEADRALFGGDMESTLLADVGGAQEYFPQMLIDQDYEDETHNAYITITNTMDKNQAM